MTNALDSLYGDGHANATRTAECVGMPGVRNQVVCTPLAILEPVRELWGSIALDPCASLAPAFDGYYEEVRGRQKWHPGTPDPNSLVRAETTYSLEAGQDGLALPWRNKTFWNPPYANLRAWIEKEHAENVEAIGLFPARTHRKWLQLDRYDRVNFLDPLKFYDCQQAAPFPCLLVYRGLRGDDFCDVTRHLGRPVRVVGR